MSRPGATRGSLEDIVKRLPGGDQIGSADLTERETEFRHMEAMIGAMTRQ